MRPLKKWPAGVYMDKRPRRKNIRLKDYDYSQPGYYFITICAKDGQKLFGEITCCRGGALPHPVLELTGSRTENPGNGQDQLKYSHQKPNKRRDLMSKSCI
jgi:hypothetical protein